LKKTKKLELKKVTLRNLDELTLDAMAGGVSPTLSCNTNCLTCGASCRGTCPPALME
jgi:hypothetical protein